jgi:hypothetical protein
MLDVFEKALEERQGRGWFALARFTILELAGLLTGAGSEWIARMNGTGPSVSPDARNQAERRIEFLIERTVYAIAHHDFEGARLYSAAERRERDNLRNILLEP